MTPTQMTLIVIDVVKVFEILIIENDFFQHQMRFNDAENYFEQITELNSDPLNVHLSCAHLSCSFHFVVHLNCTFLGNYPQLNCTLSLLVRDRWT